MDHVESGVSVSATLLDKVHSQVTRYNGRKKTIIRQLSLNDQDLNNNLDILEIHTARLDKLHFVKAKPFDWMETRTMRISDDENTKYR